MIINYICLSDMNIFVKVVFEVMFLYVFGSLVFNFCDD